MVSKSARWHYISNGSISKEMQLLFHVTLLQGVKLCQVFQSMTKCFFQTVLVVQGEIFISSYTNETTPNNHS